MLLKSITDSKYFYRLAKSQSKVNVTEIESKMEKLFIISEEIQNTTTTSQEVAAPSKEIEEEESKGEEGTSKCLSTVVEKVKERSPFFLMSSKERIEARGGYMARINDLNDDIDLCLNERREVCNTVDRLTDTIKKLKSEYEDGSLIYGVELEMTILRRKLSAANEDMCFIESEIRKKDKKLKQFSTYVIQLNCFYEEDKMHYYSRGLWWVDFPAIRQVSIAIVTLLGVAMELANLG